MVILDHSNMNPISASKKTRNAKMRQHQSLYDYVYPSSSLLNDHSSNVVVAKNHPPLHRQDSQPAKLSVVNSGGGVPPPPLITSNKNFLVHQQQ